MDGSMTLGMTSIGIKMMGWLPGETLVNGKRGRKLFDL
jgi:hypothetical protein